MQFRAISEVCRLIFLKIRANFLIIILRENVKLVFFFNFIFLIIRWKSRLFLLNFNKRWYSLLYSSIQCFHRSETRVKNTYVLTVAES